MSANVNHNYLQQCSTNFNKFSYNKKTRYENFELFKKKAYKIPRFKKEIQMYANFVFVPQYKIFHMYII